uniref:START domain-containing protein n=1 Tax=Kalanchoe fedtschenkoi TaxID=63787 RepID=A0A7N0UGD7_KALFE
MALLSILMDLLWKPSFLEVLADLVLLLGPLSVAVVAGVLLGWSWRPDWVNSDRPANSDKQEPLPPSGIWHVPSIKSIKLQLPSCISWTSEDAATLDSFNDASSSKAIVENSSSLVNERDLEHLSRLVEVTDGGPAWIQMMDRSTSTMSYQAWRRDPETGPPQYRSRTYFEDATPEMVRDLFWDDEFRAKWDDMLIEAVTLDECPTTGTMQVKWTRKFPFFCSDREYIIGRRIWECGKAYYCVTKGIPNSIPRFSKPRRVDLYYSSWFIRAAESKRDGQLTACEVLLFHHEDMGIPYEIAKLGIRQGMWGAVKKIEPGLRAYQKHRAAGAPLSQCASMAQVNAKVRAEYLKSLDSSTSDSSKIVDSDEAPNKPAGRNIPKLLVVGGALALLCSIDRGLLTKAVLFGVGRRVARFGR